MAFDIPFKHYHAESDEYRLPDGRVVAGSTLRRYRRELNDRIEDARIRQRFGGYDPYNSASNGPHMARLLQREA